jgi:tight adherence protein B
VTYLLVAGLTSLTIIALMPAIVVGTLPRAYLGRRRARRVIEVQQSWPDGIRDIISSVRSGASLPNSVESLAKYGPAPLREAFASFATYARSIGFVPALEMVRSDLADPTSDRVIEVLIVAYEKGGSVVPEILSDLAEATTRDIWTLEEIRTEALEQKINSRVVFVLPWVVLVAMTARSGAFREFYSTPAGAMVAAIGGVMSIIGILVAARLGKQPEEPRVLATGGGVR